MRATLVGSGDAACSSARASSSISVRTTETRSRSTGQVSNRCGGWLGSAARASQPAGERVAAAGGGQAPPLAGEIRQPRELREYRERRQTALTHARRGTLGRASRRRPRTLRSRSRSGRASNRERQERAHHDGGRNAYAAPVAKSIETALDYPELVRLARGKPRRYGGCALGRHSALRVDRPDLDDRAGRHRSAGQVARRKLPARRTTHIRRIDTLLSSPGRSRALGRYSDLSTVRCSGASRARPSTLPSPVFAVSVRRAVHGAAAPPDADAKGGRRRSPGRASRRRAWVGQESPRSRVCPRGSPGWCARALRRRRRRRAHPVWPVHTSLRASRADRRSVELRSVLGSAGRGAHSPAPRSVGPAWSAG